MAFGINSGVVGGDPQSPNYKEPEIPKEENPGFKHWFNKNMNNLQVEYMDMNNEAFLAWAKEKWKG